MPEQDLRQKKLLGGVAVLMPAALFTKIVGLCYKIPLIAIVGVSGMAYFLAAYHVYSVVFVLSATGLPTALSLLVARLAAKGEGTAPRRALGVALLLFLSVGLCGTAALWCLAPFLAERIAMADAAAAIMAIAPALLLAAFTGAVKGYFQGLHRMLPTALCEVLEAAGKLGFGLWFALLAKGRGLPPPLVAAYAIFGITAGLALAALVLGVWLLIHLLGHRQKGEGTPPPRRALLGELCRVALPITANSLVMSLATLLDTALISGRLQAAGFAPEVANGMYSAYGNLAMPLYNLVPALLAPVNLSLMPLLGTAFSKGDVKGGREVLSGAMRLTALLSIPAALGLAVFAEPLLELIYGSAGAAVATAAPLLSLLALSVLPVTLLTLLGAALQAVGHTVLPVIAMGVGALVKLLAECLLLSLPAVQIYGAPISTLLCNLTVLVIEAIALSRVLSGAALSPGALFRPLLASAPAVAAGAALYIVLQRQIPFAILPALLLTVCLFALLALRTGALCAGDLAALPMGDRLYILLCKCKLMK